MGESGSYGFPYIPFSRLKEMRKKAAIYMEEGFDDYDLWILMVRNEADRLYAEYWYGEIEKARNYIGIEGYGCPLCVYDEGKFIAYCEPHRQLHEYREQNEKLKNTIANLVHRDWAEWQKMEPAFDTKELVGEENKSDPIERGAGNSNSV